MTNYEKILRKQLRRDAWIGIGIISLLVVMYFTLITLL
jgi:hypothetical protein